MFRAKDKIAKLQRLMKPIDEWNSQKDLPPILRIGKPALSVNSEEFQEWRDCFKQWLMRFKETEESPLATANKTRERANAISQTVFIGHGRSLLWGRLQLYLQDELGLRVVNFESESRTGNSIVSILAKMLGEANFAILILTAEDETATGSMRARQNVIHEVGLFQSKLGFNKAILLKQDGVEDFTNVAGLQYTFLR